MSWVAQYNQNGTWHDMKFDTLNVQTVAGGLIQGGGND